MWSGMYQSILDEFVAEGWVECVETQDGYAYYAINRRPNIITMFMIEEAAASVALDNDEVGTFSLE